MRQWTRFAVCIEMGNMPARMTFKLRLTCRWGKTDSKPSVPPVKETAVEGGSAANHRGLARLVLK